MTKTARERNVAHTIWKFPIPISDNFVVEMPAGATILTVQVQAKKPFIWAVVDPEKPIEQRRFALRGTGHWLHPAGWNYVGSFQMNDGVIVFHLFAGESEGG